MTPLRFMGIDYGTKRIGVAISDENNTLAFPKEIVLNDVNTLGRLADIIKNDNFMKNKEVDLKYLSLNRFSILDI